MSCRDMTLNEIKAADKDFGAKHTITVKGFINGDRNHGGRKPGSKNKISINSVNEKVDKLAFVVYENQNNLVLLNSKIDRLASIVEQLVQEMHNGFAQINSRIDKLDSRIDNLVAKNNLKE